MNNHASAFWAHHDAELRKLWAAGLSATKIAARLGAISRNSVIGRLHRIGLRRGTDGGARSPIDRFIHNSAAQKGSPRSLRAAGSAAPAGSSPRPAPSVSAIDNGRGKHGSRKRRAEEPGEATDLPADYSASAVSIWEIDGDKCHYPLNATEPIDAFRMCGAARTHGSYCARHHRICSVPVKKSESDEENAIRRALYRKRFATKFSPGSINLSEELT